MVHFNPNEVNDESNETEFYEAFNTDVISLARQKGFTVPQACQVLEIGETALCQWVMHCVVKLAKCIKSCSSLRRGIGYRVISVIGFVSR